LAYFFFLAGKESAFFKGRGGQDCVFSPAGDGQYLFVCALLSGLLFSL